MFITNTKVTCSRLFAHILTPLPTGPYNFPPRELIRAAELLTSSVHISHPWEDVRRDGTNGYKWRGHVTQEPGRNTDLASPRHKQRVACLAFCYNIRTENESDVSTNVPYIFTVHPLSPSVLGGTKFREKKTASVLMHVTVNSGMQDDWIARFELFGWDSRQQYNQK